MEVAFKIDFTHTCSVNIDMPTNQLVQWSSYQWNSFSFSTGCYLHRSLWDFYWLYPPVWLQIAVLVSAGFMACWTPYGLVSLWSIFRDSSTIPPEISLLPCMFAKSSTVYNPLIYYIFSQSFKREVKQLLLCCHASNSVNDNGIYMVSASIKSKVETRSTLQRTTEPKSGTLEWKTFLERLYSLTKCCLIMYYLRNIIRMDSASST